MHSPTTPNALAAGLAGALQPTPDQRTEALIRAHWSAHDVLLTDSGTSALTLAIAAAVPRNGIVALPAYACYDLATAADGAHVRVALYDVDPNTLAPDQASLTRALAHGAQAIVIVHLYGVPVDMDAVSRLAGAAGAFVIEDAAQAIGASWKGKPAGAHGDFGILSFGRGKGLNGGGGGALLARDARAAEMARQLRSELPAAHAGWSEWVRATAQWALARPWLYGVPASLPFLRLGETIYHPAHAARSLSRASRRMLERNWQRAHDAGEIRRGNAERLRRAALDNAAWRLVQTPVHGAPGYLRLPLLHAGVERDRLLEDRAKRLGIMPGYPRTLASLPGFRDRCINAAESFPGAERLARNLITMPTHELLTNEDLLKLESWLRDA